MKKIAVIFIFFFIPFLFTGCIVQSLHPFYTKGALIKLPQLDGEWQLLESTGSDVSKKNIKPWTFKDDEIQTFDGKGVGSVLNVKYFKVDDALFMDITAGEPDETKLNLWWYMHVVPVHSVASVKMKEDMLMVFPLDYDWVEEALKEKKISLPHIKIDGENMIVFTAGPETWMAFLRKYRDDETVFPDKLRYVLKRHEQQGIPPYDIVAGNLKSTDVTVGIEIVNVTVERVIMSDNSKPGYIVYKIKARVLKPYKGQMRKGDEFFYYYFLEAGLNPPEKGTRHIASFNRKNEEFVIPDVGYHFQYSKELDRLFEKAGREER